MTQNSQKMLVLESFFNKVAIWRPETLFKTRLHHRSFPQNYAKFLITAFWQNTSWWMLLKVVQVTEIIFKVKLVLRSWEISLPNTFFHIFPHLQFIYFHFRSFATWHDKKNIFEYLFRNVWLGNTTERNV